ncbi:hypothetical protein QF026_004121 [Streptomyces aurantiacus]|uniref:hypothetical protein n=1 Tax=Streptomyces aurantiacus TaxID=47760 RepID=UPI002792318E|nr:hypothetical protein [Streptomyces aurantiacus]MDQ0775655.1 hypothetical protein [Streptomyces aurantiacus]
MSNQPYEGNQPYDGPYEGPYEGYDPYQQQQQQQQQQQSPGGWAGQQPYDEAAAQQQYTQQWEGQTWETRVQPPVAPAAETAYLPQQGPSEPSYGAPQQSYGAQYGVMGQPMPAETAETGWSQTPQPQQFQPQGQGQGQVQGQGQGAHRAPAAAPAPASTSPSGGTDSAYGPPTVTGNTRVTDAQRARAEGRSPIIEPGGQPAVLTAALGLLLAGAAAVGQYALVVPLVILQAVTAAGWFRLNGMWPARQGIALAFAGALTADVALLAAGRENAPAAILGTLGVWVLLTLVVQLRSRAEPDERMLGLMATVVSAALAIIATGHLGADPDAVIVGGVAVAAAVLARAVPLPTAGSVVVALLAAAGAGVAMGGVTDLGAGGAVLGAGVGVCALVGHRVASYDYPSKFVHFTAGVALPLAAAAPVVYLLGRALV